MYIPAHFAPDDDSVQALLSRHGAADLVTATINGLVATTLPFHYDHERAKLMGHLARNNDQWRLPMIGDALVIVRGPDSYITPSWYASKAKHGRVVPTWNYITVHVYGSMIVHQDPDWLADVVRHLTDKHEAQRPHPWSVDDAPPGFLHRQLRAIVGVELTINRIEAKFKLSQNRLVADIDGVIKGLREDGQEAAAAAVEEHRT
ncbi:transcriptional regulator [Lentzea pudingi]|uniref:Transcriptional regulator n=1 Tax=Lentzea pudingi TaxID=1789439 RepID=A0ABQ2ITG4_9PSEU|nr:FMN-binding negative transcriptional regulator [Lentzea pudingi]GGN29991.1 transcriptional regulator [Lentzea pudingi]